MGGRFFETVDANKDGKVTLVEAKAEAQARFTSIDTNKDGRLTTQELEAHHAAKRAEHAKKDGDADHGGKHAAWREKHKERGAKFFAKVDANGDGAIDAAESVAKAEKMFARMDDNSDGVVTKDEIGRGGHCGHGRGDKPEHEGAAGSGPKD
jgi:Ca2+-binding EF-hand superfamily protein